MADDPEDIEKANRFTEMGVIDDFSVFTTRLKYDRDTGVFTWRFLQPSEHYSEHACRALNARDAGRHAGVPMKDGYLRVQILGKKYLLHRVAWLLERGVWPPHEIDHVNGDPADNRWVNLRAATHTQNARNAARRHDNTTGCTGVYNYGAGTPWMAKIRIDGKLHSLGSFRCETAAVLARKTAERQHAFHVNHGRPARLAVPRNLT